MKRIYILCFQLVFAAILMRAQGLVVHSFQMDEKDLTANTAGTIVLDRNGKKCALIKIESKIKGLSFDAGEISIVKTEQKIGEVWVYVPDGLKKLSLFHPLYGALKDFDLGLALKRAKTYILKLAITGQQIEDTDQISQYVIFRLNPKDATVIIDGDTLHADKGMTMKKLGYGTYDYRVMAPEYQDEVGKVFINNPLDSKYVDVKLKSLIEKALENLPGDTIYRLVKVGKVKFKMIFVKGGTFQQATLSPYFIGETEVTQALWNAVMGKKNNPSLFSVRDNIPVNNVSWEDCQNFIIKLNQKTGLTFRLPTEAEWEFAASGGNKSHGYKYSGSNFLGDVGWYSKNTSTPQEVKNKRCNELGLYDMSGNVSEWCANWYENYMIEEPTNHKGAKLGNVKAIRGGNCSGIAEHCGVSYREENACKYPEDKGYDIGFRLAL